MGLRLAVTLYSCAVVFLSITKCDLVPTHSLRYLGLMCDRGRAVFHVPSDKLCLLRDFIRQVLVDGVIPLSTPVKIAGKCMSIKVAIRPASLWTHYMFEMPNAPTTVSGSIACESLGGVASVKSSSCGVD